MSTVKALSKKPAKGLIQMNRRQNAEKNGWNGKRITLTGLKICFPSMQK